MIKIIFLDIDGTLIDPKAGRMTEAVRQAMKRIQEKGIIPVLVSGRPLFAVAALAHSLSITSYIAFNGGMTVAESKMIDEIPIEQNILEQFITYAEKQGHPLIIPGHDRYYVTWKVNPLIAGILRRVNTSAIVYDPEYWKTHKVYQIELLSSPSGIIRYLEFFEKHLQFYPWYILANTTSVNSVRSSKSEAMLKILNHFSLEASASAAIGDGPNDIEMIQTAQFGIAMGNACSELKAAADFITDDVSNDGVITALHKVMHLKSDL